MALRARSAVVRIKDTDISLAISTDCNGSHVYINPRQGAMMAVAESARNVVCSGAEPLAITNCLNFGNPQDPEVYWQFKEAVLGMGDMCRKLNTPVTGGNVSFYNESNLGAVYPTPVIGMVGLLEDSSKHMDISYKDAGDIIVAIGAINGELGGSEFLKQCHGKVEGPIPGVDLALESSLHKICLKLISDEVIKSAHDISDGGLSVNIAESVCSAAPGIGAKISIDRKLREDQILFGETQGVIIVTLDSKNLHQVALVAQEHNVYTQTLGSVTNSGKLEINRSIDVSRVDLEKAYFNTLENIMAD